MSKYIEDIQGRIDSNPINETNTHYPFIDSGKKPKESHIDYQYMYNHNEPVSDIDTAYYDDYRNKVEELRKRTESTYEALEACLVPSEIPGMSFQPYEIEETEDDDGNITQDKYKSFTYFFQDHQSPISVDSQEFVFRTNKVKFIDDRRRRLIYDRTIHIMSSKEDEDNGVTFKEVLYRTFFEYWNNDYRSKVRTVSANQLSIDNIMTRILNDIAENKKEYYVYDDEGNPTLLDCYEYFDRVLQCGQDIDTQIPSTLYNLHNIGWVHPSMIFLNGLAIDWTKVIISVDNIDTFIIVSNMYTGSAQYINDDEEIYLDYLYIPFKVIYMVGGSVSASTTPESKYLNENNQFDSVIFVIDKRYACIRGDYVNQTVHKNLSSPENLGFIDRVICVDPNIKFAEFYISESTGSEKYLPDAGIQYTKSFKTFCDNDYRCKLKRFNFIGFELDRYAEEFNNSSIQALTLKNDDFDVTWHPFNIMDIRFKRLYNRRRLFKVFYNTKVLYDQDNILRIKNHDRLADEYEKYRKDVTANIETYLNEIYILAKKDIGTYIATTGKMKGYKYHYVSPYECFLLYNIIQTLDGKDYTSFDDFRNVNVSPNTGKILNYLNGGFIAFDDDHNYFSEMIKESTLLNGSVVKPDINAYFYSLLTITNCSLTDILMPIDNEIGDDASNRFAYDQGDSRGKIMPFSKFIDEYGLIQEYDDLSYDQFKLRFEMVYLNNMEEGATPVDEFIYYFDNENLEYLNKYPVVSSYSERYTANVLNAIANNIFQKDPNLVLDSIIKMNYQADYIIPTDLDETNREDVITYLESDAEYQTSDYQRDQRYFYNYGYYDENNNPKKLQSEWGLRRSLPEMFYWSLDEDEYTIKSMHLLDEVFDFTYGFDKSYEANLKAGTNYILGYDADKLEQSIKRSVVSITRTGKELREYINNHPCVKDYTIDAMKYITFVSNNNYKIAFDNIRIIVTINKSGVPTIEWAQLDYSNKILFSYGTVEMKFKSQENTTITHIGSNYTFTDIDKKFSAKYSHYVIDKENGEIIYKDENDNIVVRLQFDKLYDYQRLQMSRWNIGQQENYVMIFKNRELFSGYHTIEYNDISFSVDYMTESPNDNDIFEFVFFLNANNTIMKKYCETEDDLKLSVPNAYYSNRDSSYQLRTDKNGTKMDKGLYKNITETTTFDSAIASNTSILDAENVQLLVNVMPTSDSDEETYDVNIENTTYELSHVMYSYNAKVDTSYTEANSFVYNLEQDTKINGLHRVTKQGGGEYFLAFDGSVPKKSDSSSSTTVTPGTSTGSSSSAGDIALGAYSFCTNNILAINFEGTMEEWENVAKNNPWLSSKQNLANNKSVRCSDGLVQVTDEECAY